MKANMSLRAYEIFQAENSIPDPHGLSNRSPSCCASLSVTGSSTASTIPR